MLAPRLCRRVLSTRIARMAGTIAAFAFAASTSGCSVAMPVRTEQPVRAHSYVRVNADPPALLLTPAGALPSQPICYVREVEGRVDREQGDTLVFAYLEHLTAAAPPDSARSDPRCPDFNGSVSLVRTSGIAISQRRVRWGRTALLMAGIAAVVLALAAAAASSISYDY